MSHEAAGQAVSASARDDDRMAPVIEVAGENPGPALGTAVSAAAAGAGQP